MLYDSYSMGLTLICLIATIYMLFSKENKILSVVILLFSIFPIFNYILNGFLYVNAKALIPFIPLVLINVADFLNILFAKMKHRYLIVIYIIVSSLFICINCNLKDTLMTKNDNNIDSLINQIIENDNLYRINTSLLGKDYINKVINSNEYKTTMYSSTFNQNYKYLYTNTFENPLLYRNKFMISSSNNLLFQMYMGEKYILTKEEYDTIYQKINSNDLINVYQNNYVLPIGYATSEVINEEEFSKLSYPDNIINMLGRTIIEEKTNTDIITTLKLNNLEYQQNASLNVKVTKLENGYEIKAKKDAMIDITLDNDMTDKILILSFDILENVTCNNNDLSITINDVKNKLTCSTWKYYNENTTFSYTILNNHLKISFAPGTYKIGNINMSLIDFNIIKENVESVDEFIIDKEKTSGDVIIGDIDVQQDAYFMLSIPYDKGFTILVDGEEVEYYKANNAFIGFDISKGQHHIEINYKAPYKNIGILLSLLGIVLYISIIIKERMKKRWK
jgi:uncharacterized membrane protein YfhO